MLLEIDKNKIIIIILFSGDLSLLNSNVLLSVNEKLCDMNEQDNLNAKRGFLKYVKCALFWCNTRYIIKNAS